MSFGPVLHDPNGVEYYDIEWEDWLNGATISASTWSIVPSGPVLTNPTSGATITGVYVTGGTLGKMYSLTNRLTSGAGEVADRTIILRCGEE